MKLSAATFVLRPRGVLELLDLALRACHRDRRVYRRLSLVTLVPAFLIFAALRIWLDFPVASWLGAIAVGGLLEGAFTAVSGELMFAPDVAVRKGLGQFARRLHWHVIGRGMGLVLMAVVTFVLITPLVGGQLLFVTEVVQLERANGFGGLWRASKMSRLGARIVTWLWLVAARLTFVTAFVVLGLAVGQELLQIIPPQHEHLVAELLALAGWFASVPYVATARFLAYIDGRTRQEGWDLQLRFAAIVARRGTP